MKISNREMVLGLITMTAVMIGVGWYAVSKKSEEWKAMADAIGQNRQSIRRYQTAIQMQETWLDELNHLQSGLRKFPQDGRSVSPELMKAIKEISSRHDLDITRSQPFNEKQTLSLYELGINCTWQGGLDAIVGFLAELQLQGVSYDVRQLNVSPAGKDSGMLKGNMVIHCAYTRVDEAELEKVIPEEEEE